MLKGHKTMTLRSLHTAGCLAILIAVLAMFAGGYIQGVLEDRSQG